ncbi:cold-responsive protein kinase 1-like isoform X1 [Salvia splendens]|uniref:cold-responsive protein kinase 1-like isoform X1 n=1 Tax=Salvia splendens TaxID=180675 RepID=UPI001C260E66|nr:cold-responsive protein kinase 1-like isoform X1 [Salvia splendens]XP_041991629.1 cold-responsive protein kinase 1-like isoform X1 [Salvia splendens]XP_041991630.1 cold-responsive protein kinase 1-like isoform X1 [Salvia splendens]XP_041991631.1 cold-responsive protein kinase 1-like isoform X1 [Salvia splendens]
MSCSCFGTSSLMPKRRDKHANESIQAEEEVSITKTKNFTYNLLVGATNNFHRSNKIGRGGFGTVYKGVLKNGREVAVKVLSAESKQGEREFMTEIDTISNVKHPNLVELLGCCVYGHNRILVYEYLENSSIDRALLGFRKSLKLEWEKRSAICMGTARGLAYLHEELVPHIVHRDIKASNILLDEDLQPKIGDFGLAKLFPDNITHISTKIAGTTGYLAPEYVLGGQLTLKADVYSFGVLTLEVVSGRSSGNTNYGGGGKLLMEWAWELYEEGKLLDLVDPELEEFPKDEVIKYMKVALFCAQANASRRPLMSQVTEMLSRNVRLNEDQLTPPGFFEGPSQKSGMVSKNKSSDTSTSHQMSSFPITTTEVSPR